MDEIEQQPVWIKSDACEDAACVELCLTAEFVSMRNSTSPDDPVVTWPVSSWSAFLRDVVPELAKEILDTPRTDVPEKGRYSG